MAQKEVTQKRVKKAVPPANIEVGLLITEPEVVCPYSLKSVACLHTPHDGVYRLRAGTYKFTVTTDTKLSSIPVSGVVYCMSSSAFSNGIMIESVPKDKFGAKSIQITVRIRGYVSVPVGLPIISMYPYIAPGCIDEFIDDITVE